MKDENIVMIDGCTI